MKFFWNKGNLLSLLVVNTEGQLKLRNKIKGAMTYPVIMMIAGGGMIGIIFIFVIPKAEMMISKTIAM